MKTSLADVAATIVDVVSKIKGDDAEDLLNVMCEWEEENPQTYSSLIQQPAFRKMWDALEQACEKAIDDEYECEECKTRRDENIRDENLAPINP